MATLILKTQDLRGRVAQDVFSREALHTGFPCISVPSFEHGCSHSGDYGCGQSLPNCRELYELFMCVHGSADCSMLLSDEMKCVSESHRV